MDPALRELLRLGQAEPDQVLEAIIRLRRPGLEVPGVRIVSRFGAMATCRVPLRLVPSVHAHPDVVSLKAPRPLGPDSGAFSLSGPADPGGAGGRRGGRYRRRVAGPLTGAGVVVGVVDWGLDVDHPNFKTDDGRTRLLALWDQRGHATGRAPQPYGYGTLHRRAEIDEALAGPTPYRTLGYDPADADRGGGSHGTHVTDIAAGNGRAGGPIGVAHKADLVFVHLADRATRGLATLGDSVRLLEAIDCVACTAADRPWVVNLSVGQNGGPHDGTLAVERALDELLATTPGALVVQSAGNYEQARTHASGTLGHGERRTLTFVVEPTDVTANELEIWYDGDDELAVHIQPPGGDRATVVGLGADGPIDVGGRRLGWVYHRARDPNNGDHHVDAFLSPRAPAGPWRVTLEAVRVRSGRFHAWIERDDSCAGCQPRFAPADSDPASTLGTIATSRLPLIVGAYNDHRPDRPAAPFSSAGPTRDGRVKPDVAAPGDGVLAARSAPRGSLRSPALHTRKSGTSMAAPKVTGAVALCLQAGGRRLDAASIRGLILETADPAVTAQARSRLGRGYLNLSALTAALAADASDPRPRDHKETAMGNDLAVTVPLALAPATAYRELLYHPGGPVSLWIEERFDVLARPGQRLTEPPREGDVVLQLTLGRPGPGDCAVLTGTGLTRRRANRGLAASGWYASATGILDPTDVGRLRILDTADLLLDGLVLLRPRLGDRPPEEGVDPEEVPHELPDDLWEDFPDKSPDDLPDDVTDEFPDDLWEDYPDEPPDDLPEDAPVEATLTQDEDPERYTEPAGKKNVAGSGTTRREVRHLKYGVVGGFQSNYKNLTNPKGISSAEKQMTRESPDNMAVVIMPDSFDPARPVQVILHFHGWGFRGGTDPYAGYLVASGKRGGDPPSKRGTVRDVDQEHWEQQIGAVNRERAKGNGPQVVAILAQGRGMSHFGSVPMFDYVHEVLSHVPELAGITRYSIILSGHSGGGSQVATVISCVAASTVDRAKLAARKPGEPPGQPADLVLLFDAEGIEKTMDWVEARLCELRRALKAAATAAEAQVAIAATPRFRGYFAAGCAYAARYKEQNKRLCAALAKVPGRWTCLDPANPTAVKVPDLFRIIQVSGTGVDHEHVISGGTGPPADAGALADALRASLDPTRDRASALGCAAMKPCGAPAPKPGAGAAPAPKPGGGAAPEAEPGSWTASDATSEYALTERDRELLASQTSEQRAKDRAALDKKALRRLAALEKARKKGALTGDEETQLAELRALKERVEATKLALGRKDVEEILRAARSTVPKWYGDIQKGTFLGLPVRVHRALAARLTQAEAALVADREVNPSRLDAAGLGKRLQMDRRIPDMRPPKLAVGGTRYSLHSFGLAVDLNYRGNPFIGNAGPLAPEVVRRATRLVNGTAIDLMTKLGDASAAYATLEKASEALKTYLSYRHPAKEAELTEKVAARAAAAGEPADVAAWLKQIKTDHAHLSAGGDFQNHKPPDEGFLDFNKAVVLTLTGVGLCWGGTYNQAKDIMHFDLHQGEAEAVNRARDRHKPSE